MTSYAAPEYYLPHKKPMVLLDEVIAVDSQKAHCRVILNEKSALFPFLDQNGHLPSWYALEIMAQTVGVWSGWNDYQQGNCHPKLGMLLGGRGIKCQSPIFSFLSVLDIFMELLIRDEKFGSFEGKIICNDEIVCYGRINTYEPDKQEIAVIKKG